MLPMGMIKEMLKNIIARRSSSFSTRIQVLKVLCNPGIHCNQKWCAQYFSKKMYFTQIIYSFEIICISGILCVPTPPYFLMSFTSIDLSFGIELHSAGKIILLALRGASGCNFTISHHDAFGMTFYVKVLTDSAIKSPAICGRTPNLYISL